MHLHIANKVERSRTAPYDGVSVVLSCGTVGQPKKLIAILRDRFQSPGDHSECQLLIFITVGYGHEAGRHERRLIGPKNSSTGLPGS